MPACRAPGRPSRLEQEDKRKKKEVYKVEKRSVDKVESKERKKEMIDKLSSKNRYKKRRKDCNK
jgi:hypothetical protein